MLIIFFFGFVDVFVCGVVIYLYFVACGLWVVCFY